MRSDECKLNQKPEPKKELQLECGKQYVYRDGSVSDPLEETFFPPWIYRDPKRGLSFQKNGSNGNRDVISQNDLVAEYIDANQKQEKDKMKLCEYCKTEKCETCENHIGNCTCPRCCACEKSDCICKPQQKVEFKVWDEKLGDSETKEVFLKLMRAPDGVRVVACEKDGEVITDLVGFYNEGTLIRYKHTVRDLPYQRDDEGRIKLDE
jgi:hypothetical protein